MIVLNHCLNWFKVSSLKAKPKMIFQFTSLGRKKDFQCKCKFRGNFIVPKDKVILLGTIIDNKLTVEAHLENPSKKASYKLCALQRIRKFPTVMQAQTLPSLFVNSQFNCCTTVWMFYSRKPKLK